MPIECVSIKIVLKNFTQQKMSQNNNIQNSLIQN